jgi:hypothetical protein
MEIAHVLGRVRVTKFLPHTEATVNGSLLDPRSQGRPARDPFSPDKWK